MADSLAALAADLRAAARGAPKTAHAVVKRGAVNVKRDWRANAKGSAGAHARHYPSSIAFDITPPADVVVAEIGADKTLRQGPLGNLLEYGSRNSPPHNDGGRALRAEEPRFVGAATDAFVDLLR